MALAEELARTVDHVRSAVPAGIFGAIGQSIADLKATGQAETAVRVGDKIAVPTLQGLDGSAVDLAAMVAAQPTVLLFYRGGWCPKTATSPCRPMP